MYYYWISRICVFQHRCGSLKHAIFHKDLASLKKILLITSGLFHPPLWGRLVLHKTLEELSEFSFFHVSSLEKLPRDLDTFAALVLHFHHKKISDSAFGRLDHFVRNGGGILAVHAATASFKDTLPYFNILGGRFIGHGAVDTLEIRKVNDNVFAGLNGFTLKDELYIHELQPKIDTHFVAKHEGKDVPVVWTYRYHKGKVCYALPGHTTGSMMNKDYQKILQRGLQWVAE